MLVSILADEKRRGRPPGRVYTATLPVRLTAEQLLSLDAWAEAEKISRSEAIRRLVEEALKAKQS